MVKTRELERYINELLAVHQFKDYSPNGLQIEGCEEIKTIVTGVTASQRLIDEAINHQADLLLVHHGYFWTSEDPRIIDMKGRRIRALIKNDINLMGYHLPLDAHPELGNNVQLGRKLGFSNISSIDPADPQCLIYEGYLPRKFSSDELAEHLMRILGQAPIVSHQHDSIQKIAWCTGGAQNYLNKILMSDYDAFISGEISEHTVHTARENDIVYFSAGHHATERYGIEALGKHLKIQFPQLNVHFIDIHNPA